MSETFKLLKTPARVAGALFAAALFASAQAAVARPGMVNYTEGQVTLDGRTLGSKAIGKTEVAPDHVLETTNGKAEMLLIPGAFLRLGQNSAVKMISPSITDTRVELLRGEALVEVDQLQKENHLDVIDHGADTQIEKKGVYRFNGDQPLLAVYDGKAKVQMDDQSVDVGKGKELPLQPEAKLKPQKFDKHQTDALYDWSKLRSSYLAEANMSSAQMVVVNDYPGWWAGTGWYWNPWFDTWSFVPGGGFLYSPFGYGFYSPAYWYYNAPAYYYGPGRVWTRRPIGGGGVVAGSGAVARPAPVGGNGVRFGSPRAVGSMARPMAAPAMHAPALGGSGVRFGGGRR